MPDKGRIMSQVYYERQSKLIKLYKECIIKKEMNVNEAVMALRLIGFSEAMAYSRVREWAEQINNDEAGTNKTKNQRLRQRASLEKYMFRIGLGKKYDGYVKLQKMYIGKKLSKNEIMAELIQLGYSVKFAEYIIIKWESYA